MLAVVLLAPFAAGQTLTVETFVELQNDPGALRGAVEQMSDEDLAALGDAVTDAMNENYRDALAMETTLHELQRLQLLQSGGAPINPLVGDFLSLDARGQQDFVDRMSVGELETLAEDLERQIQEDHRIAQQLEIALMQQEVLLKRMAANPISARDPRCDPGSMCRTSCTTVAGGCKKDAAQIAKDCAMHANELYGNCERFNASKITQCLGNRLINLGLCAAQRTGNQRKCGLGNVNCQDCCSSFATGRRPLAMCIAHITNVELDSTLPSMQ